MPTKPWPKYYILLSICALALPFLDGLQGRLLVGDPARVLPVRDSNGYYQPMPVAPSLRSSIIWTPSSGDGGGFQGGK